MATKNEESSIGDLLEQLSRYPVLLVDDSDDRTREIAGGFENVEIVSGPGEGIAAAYLRGFHILRWRPGVQWVVQMDAGWTHSPYDVERLLDTVGDLVIGTRQFHWEGWRTGLSQLAAWLMGVEDATSGFRKWDVRLLRKMDLGAVKSRGFAFQLETLVLALKAGASVGKVPIEYRLTNSSLKPWMIAEAARVYLGKVVLNGLYT